MRRKYFWKLERIAIICFVLSPLISISQQVIYLKNSRVIESTDSIDSIIVSKFLRNIRYNYAISETSPLIKQSFKLNFQIPKVKVYNASDYYVDGKFRDLPFNSWGPYQVPFHLNQLIVVPIKEKR